MADAAPAAVEAATALPWGETDDGDLGQPIVPSAGDSLADVAPEDLPTVGHIGRYALKYRIGAGGTGTVYAAQDPLLSRLIAIKTLNVEIPDEQRESFNAMFLREARAAAGLSHPHIVTVFDAGISDSGAYIAMELLKGRDLRQLCADGWRPTPVQTAQVVRRVADALAYAHGKGVVHRDIKPANIFMVGRTQPRVLDFGIARVTHQRDGQPEDDIAGGSPYYMAPEQVMQQATDLRADVFSLGVVLYELLAGQRPFGGESLLEIGRAVLDHEPPPAHEVNPGAPAALAAIAARAMAKKPEDRYRSARMMSRELRHWLDEHAAAAAAAAPTVPARRELQHRRRAAFGGAAVSAGVLALLGAGTWLYRGATADNAAIAAATKSANPAVIATLPPVAAATPAAAAALAAPVEQIVERPAAAAEPLEANVPATTPAAPRAAPREARAAAPVVASTGVVTIAVSPWGSVEVNGRSAGVTPPLNQLTLPAGRHRITVRNQDFPPYRATVQVQAGQSVMLKHRFGS
jgi:hypothetical protein